MGLQILSLMSIIKLVFIKGQMVDYKGQTKGQKLSSAIYFVTGFFDDKEPIKWRLRTLAIDLVGENVKDKSLISKEIISLFSIAKNTNLLSETNYGILANELSKFQKELESPLYQLFFHPTSSEERALPEPEKPEIVKDKILQKEAAPKPLREFGAISVKKNSRQSTIIGLLKRKKEIMIGDVSPLITGCSEKTIQRELLAMVAAGILRKIGEKRWSKYSLA